MQNKGSQEKSQINVRLRHAKAYHFLRSINFMQIFPSLLEEKKEQNGATTDSDESEKNFYAVDVCSFTIRFLTLFGA